MDALQGEINILYKEAVESVERGRWCIEKGVVERGRWCIVHNSCATSAKMLLFHCSL